MNSEHFIKYCKYWKRHLESMKSNPEFVKTRYNIDEDKNTLDTNFVVEMDFALTQAKIFEVDDSIKKLLSLTDTPINNDEVELPFNTIFIDISFTKEELEKYGVFTDEADEVVGIMVRKGPLIGGEDKKEKGTSLRMSIMTIVNKGTDKEEYVWDTFNKNINIKPEFQSQFSTYVRNPSTDKKLADFSHKFFLNFLNFINNPEVEYVEHKRSVKNQERRRKNGLPIIPSSFNVNVTGKLKVYLNNLVNHGSWSYGYRFWVRGHFRQLHSERYSKKKRIWILPYIKGEGILVEKTYKLQEKEQ